MKLLFLLLLTLPLLAEAKDIELEITSTWITKKSKDVLLTLVYVKPEQTLNLPLEGKSKTYLNIIPTLEGKDVILKTKIYEKNEGKEKILLNKSIRAKFNKKNFATQKSKDGEGVELEIIPSAVKN